MEEGKTIKEYMYEITKKMKHKYVIANRYGYITHSGNDKEKVTAEAKRSGGIFMTIEEYDESYK